MRKITEYEMVDCVLSLTEKLQEFTSIHDDDPVLDQLMADVEKLLEPFCES
jgi:hypothetical protein